MMSPGVLTVGEQRRKRQEQVCGVVYVMLAPAGRADAEAPRDLTAHEEAFAQQESGPRPGAPGTHGQW